VVERHLAKVDVVSSNLIARSISIQMRPQLQGEVVPASGAGELVMIEPDGTLAHPRKLALSQRPEVDFRTESAARNPVSELPVDSKVNDTGADPGREVVAS
jgi:hypothetical protein